MCAVAANQSTRQLQSKMEFSFQSKVQLAVAGICLTASICNNKDANSLPEDSKVRQDFHKMLLE